MLFWSYLHKISGQNLAFLSLIVLLLLLLLLFSLLLVRALLVSLISCLALSYLQVYKAD